MRNVGSFDSRFAIDELPAKLSPKMIKRQDNDIFMKEHNTDYLSDEALYSITFRNYG